MSLGKIVLITGANTGIGYQIVRALCASTSKYNIILSGRSLDKVNRAVADAKAEFPSSPSQLEPLQVDIEHDDSILKAFEAVKSKYGKIDALVNNAGAQLDGQFISGKISEREMWQNSWNVNTSGTQVMTSTFAPLLILSSDPRLLFITSGTSTISGTEDMNMHFNKSPDAGWPKTGFQITAYRSAKAGLNMMMREWYRILKNDGVKVWAISPGFLATGLGMGNPEALKKMGAQDPEIAGPFIRDVLEGGRDKDAGKVLTSNGIQDW
ncbi:Hypothetical protein R9X50_00416000 [Acrodontium crateriforme]|uniref:Uncharacterized protein n=1 Tax=Acrodontium crateriforme TaxID=150365 RepID=A0AAQ3R9Z7_9PEZI|nr:Hypothetical protein R9X50_00416000 [Acrodontium crateriforme]